MLAIRKANESKKEPVLNAALIADAEKVTHYQTASYGRPCIFAKQLSEKNALRPLKETLAKKKIVNKNFIKITASGANLEAAGKSHEGRVQYSQTIGRQGINARAWPIEASRRRLSVKGETLV